MASYCFVCKKRCSEGRTYCWECWAQHLVNERAEKAARKGKPPPVEKPRTAPGKAT